MSNSVSLVKSEVSGSITDAKVENFRKRQKDAPPKVNSTRLDEECDGVALLARYAEAVGSVSDDFRTLVLNQIGALAVRTDRNALLNSALAVLNSFKPRNEIESLIVIEIFTLHTMFADMSGRVMVNNDAQQLNSLINWIDKLSRAIREHVSTLQKLRGEGGRQKVVVEHVHVNQGGQAIVGAVDHTGGDGGQS
jgi:hypothetical protein